MSKRRVVVTGLGAVTPIGNNVEDFWAGIREGKVGIGPITKFDTTDYKVKIAAEVKDFNAKDHMDPRAARRMDPFCQYAVTAAKEAFEDAGLDMEKEDSFRVGVIVDLLCTPAHLTFSSSLQMALLHHHQILSIRRFHSSPVQKILSDMSIVPYPPMSFFFHLTIMLDLFCHIDLKIFSFPSPHPLYFYLFLLKIIPYYETL